MAENFFSSKIEDPDLKVNVDTAYATHPGTYFCRITDTKADKDRKEIKYARVELEVLHTIDGGLHPVGEIIAMHTSAISDYFLKDVKAAVLAITQCGQGFSQAIAEAVFRGDGAKGILMRVVIRKKKTKEGKEFTSLILDRPLRDSELELIPELSSEDIALHKSKT